MPAHVGLIPDGLRRWAKSNATSLTDSYLRGAEKVTEILLALQRQDVRTASVYNLSRANLGRTNDELAAVYAATVHFLTTLVPAHFDPATCGVRIHGDRRLLPREYVAAVNEVEALMTGDAFRINILAPYDAGDELRAAYVRAQNEGCDITEAFEIPAVDLVIRTTVEPLLSGFLPYQCQYAQLIFLNTPLNDLAPTRIDELIDDYRRLPQLRGR